MSRQTVQNITICINRIVLWIESIDNICDPGRLRDPKLEGLPEAFPGVLDQLPAIEKALKNLQSHLKKRNSDKEIAKDIEAYTYILQSINECFNKATKLESIFQSVVLGEAASREHRYREVTSVEETVEKVMKGLLECMLQIAKSPLRVMDDSEKVHLEKALEEVKKLPASLVEENLGNTYYITNAGPGLQPVHNNAKPASRWSAPSIYHEGGRTVHQATRFEKSRRKSPVKVTLDKHEGSEGRRDSPMTGRQPAMEYDKAYMEKPQRRRGKQKVEKELEKGRRNTYGDLLVDARAEDLTEPWEAMATQPPGEYTTVVPITTPQEHQTLDEGDLGFMSNSFITFREGRPAAAVISKFSPMSISEKVVQVMSNDKGLGELLKATPDCISSEEFRRNFLRLFRSFLSKFENEAQGNTILKDAFHRMKRNSRNTVTILSNRLFESDKRDWSELIQQEHDEDALELYPLTESLEERAGATKEYEDDTVSDKTSGDDKGTVDTQVSLDQLEAMILQSNALSQLRAEYEAFLFSAGPNDTGTRETDILPIDALDSRLHDLDLNTIWEFQNMAVAEDTSHRLSVQYYLFIQERLQERAANLYKFSLGLLFRLSRALVSRTFNGHTRETARTSLAGISKIAMQSVERLLRPSLEPELLRFEWICDCGDSLYVDMDRSDPASILGFQAVILSSGGNPKVHEQTTQGSRASSSPSDTTQASTNVAGVQQTFSGGSSSPDPISQSSEQTTVPKGGLSGSPSGESQPSKRFIELCVNTGEFQKSLGEIDVTNATCDSDIFNEVRKKYEEIRGFRRRFFLLRPIDVHFVRFSLEDRFRVGILEKPLAIPSKEEMLRDGYGYEPVDLKPPPVPRDIFLHNFYKQAGHSRLRWGRRIPQKLDNRMSDNQISAEELRMGWGVHLIEGLNRWTVSIVSLAMLLISGIVAASWIAVTGDAQTAFGVGAYLTGIQGVILMMVLTKWNEL